MGQVLLPVVCVCVCVHAHVHWSLFNPLYLAVDGPFLDMCPSVSSWLVRGLPAGLWNSFSLRGTVAACFPRLSALCPPLGEYPGLETLQAVSWGSRRAAHGFSISQPHSLCWPGV